MPLQQAKAVYLAPGQLCASAAPRVVTTILVLGSAGRRLVFQSGDGSSSVKSLGGGPSWS
jgi:hypothetical protein